MYDYIMSRLAEKRKEDKFKLILSTDELAKMGEGNLPP
jgi:hypothetical protein